MVRIGLHNHDETNRGNYSSMVLGNYNIKKLLKLVEYLAKRVKEI